jgi:hypothetical protein
MKTIGKTALIILAMGISSVLFVQCSKENVAEPVNESSIANTSLYSAEAGNEAGQTTTLTTDGLLQPYACIYTFPAEELSVDETDALNLMREEELLAKDVYVALYAKYHIPIFNNISKSENQHTGAIKALLDKYELPDIAENHTAGVFVNQDLQSLYNALIAQGMVSINGALTVGATIEDMDIQDLINIVENKVDNADIEFVFNELHRGSRNHLRSFNLLLTKRGITYVPQFISPEYFNEIISTPHETGSGCPN